MKYKRLFIAVILLLSIVKVGIVSAGHWNIEGWEWIENKDKIVLWQKKEEEFISETLINIAAPIGCEILRGYTFKYSENIALTDYQCNNYPVGIWKIIYNGIDSSGNIYLNIIRQKDKINKSDISKIKQEIKNISEFIGTEENLIEKRIKLFSDLLNNYLEKEGEIITIDSSKIVVINSINDIPPFSIKVNEKNTIINLTVKSLD